MVDEDEVGEQFGHVDDNRELLPEIKIFFEVFGDLDDSGNTDEDDEFDVGDSEVGDEEGDQDEEVGEEVGLEVPPADLDLVED